MVLVNQRLTKMAVIPAGTHKLREHGADTHKSQELTQMTSTSNQGSLEKMTNGGKQYKHPLRYTEACFSIPGRPLVLLADVLVLQYNLCVCLLTLRLRAIF